MFEITENIIYILNKSNLKTFTAITITETLILIKKKHNVLLVCIEVHISVKDFFVEVSLQFNLKQLHHSKFDKELVCQS